MDCVRQLVTASSVVGPRRSSKALSKAKLAPEKGHGHCLVVCCPSDPLQLSESWWNHWSEKYAKQINEMHWKLQCLQPSLVNRKGPNLLHDNAWPHVAQSMLQKLNKLGYKVLPHLPYSPDLSPTDYFFEHLNNFLQGKWFHKPAGGRKCFPRVKSWSTDFFFLIFRNHFLKVLTYKELYLFTVQLDGTYKLVCIWTSSPQFIQ